MIYRKVTFLVFLITVLGFIFFSCESGTEPEIIDIFPKDTLYSTTHFLWPSTVGSYWDYEGYYFMNHFSLDSSWKYEGFASFGIDLDTVQSDSFLYKLEIVDSIFINIRDTMYECHVFDVYDPLTEKYRNFKTPYWIGDDGIYNMGIYGERGDTVFNKGLYIPTEISLNINWRGQMSYKQYGYFHSSPVLERKCLLKNEILNTPIGNFECYVIFTRIWQADDILGYYDYYNYYAQDIGMICTIRLAVTPGIPNGQVQWRLTYISIIKNYTIN